METKICLLTLFRNFPSVLKAQHSKASIRAWVVQFKAIEKLYKNNRRLPYN